MLLEEFLPETPSGACRLVWFSLPGMAAGFFVAASVSRPLNVEKSELRAKMAASALCRAALK